MELDGVASARKFVRDLVSQLDTSTAYRVELLTSELATNALLHGRSAFDIVVLEAGGRLRVEVADDCPKNAVLVTADKAAVHGRGIFIVNELADSWGSTENGAGKTVWFELAITGCQEPLPTPR